MLTHSLLLLLCETFRKSVFGEMFVLRLTQPALVWIDVRTWMCTTRQMPGQYAVVASE